MRSFIANASYMFPMNYLVFDTVPEALRYIDKVESSNQGRFVADPSDPKVGRTLAAYYITASEPEPAVPEPAPENSSPSTLDAKTENLDTDDTDEVLILSSEYTNKKRFNNHENDSKSNDSDPEVGEDELDELEDDEPIETHDHNEDTSFKFLLPLYDEEQGPPPSEYYTDLDDRLSTKDDYDYEEEPENIAPKAEKKKKAKATHKKKPPRTNSKVNLRKRKGKTIPRKPNPKPDREQLTWQNITPCQPLPPDRKQLVKLLKHLNTADGGVQDLFPFSISVEKGYTRMNGEEEERENYYICEATEVLLDGNAGWSHTKPCEQIITGIESYQRHIKRTHLLFKKNRTSKTRLLCVKKWLDENEAHFKEEEEQNQRKPQQEVPVAFTSRKTKRQSDPSDDYNHKRRRAL